MIDNIYTAKYWREEDYRDLENAQDFKDLYRIANRIFGRMPEDLGQVCGPIATGGLRSVSKNLEVFDRAIRKLQEEGKIIFDQIPFEWPMQELKKKIPDGAKTILEDFYLPILSSGKVTTLYFIPGWETSKGATWEHEMALRLGITIVYLK